MTYEAGYVVLARSTGICFESDYAKSRANDAYDNRRYGGRAVNILTLSAARNPGKQ
ncbi:MAG: hypothetical protein ACLR56_03810 [Oscillospiraceae bacterium]